LSKACFAQQIVSKKKCTTKIVQDNKSTATPIYTGMMVHYKNNKAERMQIFFYNNDIKHYMKGMRWKCVKSKPNVPNICLVKIRTNLSKKEILDLENACF
jgi:hypothetical protein